MGRKKITIKPIDCPRLRSVTFYKRRKGLLKKAMELAVLCQSHVFLAFVDNETGKLVTFNSHSVKALRDLFRKTPLHLRENFKAQDYDFLYGDSQTCNKSGKLPQRDHSNIKIEDDDEQVFDQIYGGEGVEVEQQQQQEEQSTRITKRNAKRNVKNNQRALKIQQRSSNLQNKSNEIKQCDNDSEEDKEFGFLEQNNFQQEEKVEGMQQPGLFGQKKLLQGQQQQPPQQLQQQFKHLTQYQNEDNSQNHQNFRFTGANQYDQNRVGGQVIHKSNLKLNEINDMMNLFQEDQCNQYDTSRKILNENMHNDQKQQQEDNQQTPFKDTQKKMKQKLKIQNLEIGNDQKNQPYKLNKLQSFEFIPNNIGKSQKPIDDQNSSTNTATLLQSASQQLSQNGNNINTIPLQQQLLSNQALYQQLKQINPLQSQFNSDMSPYPLLLTPSPFPSSMFLPNLGAGLTPNNPLAMNQPSQMGFDFMNHPLLSSTSPLFQVCQGLFNNQELTPVGTTTPLQNPLSSKTGVAGLNSFFNNSNQQNAISALNQALNKEKNQGSEGKQLNNLDSNNADQQAKNYYNSIINNLRPQSQGLNLQSLNQTNCLSDNQQLQQQQQQSQPEPLQSQKPQSFQSVEQQKQ